MSGADDDAAIAAHWAGVAERAAADPDPFVPRRRERTAEQRRRDAEAELDIVRLLAGGEPERLADDLARVDLAELLAAAELGPSGAH